jgi:hypothetical protein
MLTPALGPLGAQVNTVAAIGGVLQPVNEPPLSTLMLSKMYVHEGARVEHVRFAIALFLTLNDPHEPGLRLQGEIATVQSVFTGPLAKDWPSKLVSACGWTVGGW